MRRSWPRWRRSCRHCCSDAATAKRSQTYYLDLTAKEANKGNAIRLLAEAQGIDVSEIAVIGDMENDVPMFTVAGFSVAMGNATDVGEGQGGGGGRGR